MSQRSLGFVPSPVEDIGARLTPKSHPGFMLLWAMLIGGWAGYLIYLAVTDEPAALSQTVGMLRWTSLAVFSIGFVALLAGASQKSAAYPLILFRPASGGCAQPVHDRLGLCHQDRQRSLADVWQADLFGARHFCRNLCGDPAGIIDRVARRRSPAAQSGGRSRRCSGAGGRSRPPPDQELLQVEAVVAVVSGLCRAQPGDIRRGGSTS